LAAEQLVEVYKSKHSKDKKMATEAQNKVTEAIFRIDNIRQQLFKAQQELDAPTYGGTLLKIHESDYLVELH
jgi:hypothetical protein